MLKKRDNTLPFMKMHGLGNDFVVVDARASEISVTPTLARALGDRHRGVGFDQLALMTEDEDGLHLSFFNSDGSTSGACGNATRCIAQFVMQELGQTELLLQTERGLLVAREAEEGRVAVNMGQPQHSWQDIPLADDYDIDALPIEGAPMATGMGNPHCTFFMDDVSKVDLAKRGAEVEYDPIFPQRTNVQFAEVRGTDHLLVRVWERGAGITLASGSSSCAVAVAAARRGLTGRKVRIDLDGGRLDIDWREDGVWMTGPTMHVFDGTLTQEFLDTLS